MDNKQGAKAPSKAEQALNSVEAAHHAVQQAEEHPTDHMIGQAERSLRHARAAVDQSHITGSDEAADRAEAQLAKDRERMEGK
ncbi:hypothetical protein BBD41_09955 [Paenibacillus ihbetae]|uniref:DUF2564 domain-containing protein n=1 Tax=Paenibacillus ihbetae TaxID=1870820 RepID=A0A1B2DYR1_9BACL|nr:hypothetical protein [Paenibacillus ihbetae]ANY72886.1 hypothetical protein BBD41_09955 [Paenibacillus ihbetae]